VRGKRDGWKEKIGHKRKGWRDSERGRGRRDTTRRGMQRER